MPRPPCPRSLRPAQPPFSPLPGNAPAPRPPGRAARRPGPHDGVTTTCGAQSSGAMPSRRQNRSTRCAVLTGSSRSRGTPDRHRRHRAGQDAHGGLGHLGHAVGVFPPQQAEVEGDRIRPRTPDDPERDRARAAVNDGVPPGRGQHRLQPVRHDRRVGGGQPGQPAGRGHLPVGHRGQRGLVQLDQQFGAGHALGHLGHVRRRALGQGPGEVGDRAGVGRGPDSACGAARWWRPASTGPHRLILSGPS